LTKQKKINSAEKNTKEQKIKMNILSHGRVIGDPTLSTRQTHEGFNDLRIKLLPATLIKPSDRLVFPEALPVWPV